MIKLLESYEGIHNFWFENGASSVTFLEYDDGLIAFDSSLYPKKFEEMSQIIEEKTSKKLKKVFLTHFHPDHTFGCLFSRINADIFINSKTLELTLNIDKEFLRESSQIADFNFNNLKEALNKKNIYVFERSIYSILHNQIIIGENLDGHTIDSTIFVIKPQNYIITGDLVFSNVHAEILNSNLDEWISKLQQMEKLEIEKVFPGHGKVGTKTLIKEQIKYLKDKKKGTPLEKKYSQYLLPELTYLT